MNERALWIGGLAVGATALVGALAYAAGKQALPAASSASPSGGTSSAATGSTGGAAITVPTGTTIGQNLSVAITGPGTQTITVDPGTTIQLTPPSGAIWNTPTSTSTLPAGISNIVWASRTAAVQILFDGSATASVQMNWLDSNSASQTTMVTIQPTPSIQGIVLIPGTQDLKVPVGTLVVLQLPSPEDGGNWGNTSTAAVVAGVTFPTGSGSVNTPATYPFVGPGSVQFSIPWTDANGNANTTNLTVHT